MPRIYDSWDLKYKSKFGALKTGEFCTFSLRIPFEIDVNDEPVMVIFRTGFKERFLNMQLVETLDDCRVYSTTFNAKYTGVHYYYFALNNGNGRSYIKKIDCHNGEIGDGGLFQLTVFDDQFKTPDFLKGGVMYQIFPDRFCKSGIAHENVPTDRVIRNDWGGTPYYKPDENGHVWNNDYFGGDLEGVRQKLSYLKDLGVTCIYLNPIFESHENHRYNTADYSKVDPLLGTNEDFIALCNDAKILGISIILDGVFSHTGADSVYFNKFNRYDSVGAYNSADSEYFPWYTFYEYPNSYEAWWGIDTLPNVQENNSKFTGFICGNGGILQRWLDYGAAGFRLDVADELPDQFLDNLNHGVKAKGKEKIIIGEVWEDASNKESYGVKRRYLLGGQLDSVMNYPFKEAILNYIRGGNKADFRNSIMTILENYPKPSIDILMNFVSTHDVERAINILAGEPCYDKSKDWMAGYTLPENDYQRGVKLLQCAFVLMFFLPGVPSIYYGDEAGMQGCKDPFNRGCYPWGNENTELIDFVKRLSEIRHSSDVFKDGTLDFVGDDENLMVFKRNSICDDSSVIIVLNKNDFDCSVSVESEFLKNSKSMEMIFGEISDGKIELKPYSYAVIKLD